MGKTGSNKRNPYAGARLILLQDSVLCMLASLLSILLVRSLSEPIPGFSVLVWRFLAAALAGSLIGSAVSGLWKMEVRSLNAHLFGVFLLLILLKELVLAVVMIAGFVQLPSKIYAFLAISVDILFTAGLLLAPRYIFATLRREERAVARNLGRMTALVAGTGKTSVALAESAEVSGRYNVVGFLTTDRNEEGHLLDGRVVYFCEDVRDISVLQWRLGGVDTLLFPTDWEHNEARGSAGQPAASAPDHGPMTLLGYAFKRGFDIVLSALLLILFSPLIGLCALAIYIEDGKPVIYRQERIGKNGKPNSRSSGTCCGATCPSSATVRNGSTISTRSWSATRATATYSRSAPASRATRPSTTGTRTRSRRCSRGWTWTCII